METATLGATAPSMAPIGYNAAVDLVDRNLAAGRGAKTAIVDDAGSYSYAELADRVDRCANALLARGLEPEHRIVLCLLDGIDFPVGFLGAIKAGIVPIPVNTLFQPADYAYILADSRAKAAIVSAALLPVFREAAGLADWNGTIIVSGSSVSGSSADQTISLADLMAAASPIATAAATRPDDVCFWLYSSGSTGKPKGTVHLQTSAIQTAELFAQQVLGMTEHDVVYSAAKLFFAYGLGNALTFPLSVGATAVLTAGRPTPQATSALLRHHRPTIFCGVPTLFSALLAYEDLPGRADHALRLCTSAGEALPEEIARNWTERMGVEVIDGIGSTEMLHIFVSNRPGAVRYGTTGRPVPGYRVRLVDETGNPVGAGEIGELQVSGPTSAAYYWNNRERTRTTFLGDWVCTGDKFRHTPEGDLVHCGRSDDMLKVGGIWVAPMEVESALIAHPAVLEVAVVAAADPAGLIKPKAYVVLKSDHIGDDAMAATLKDFVKARLAPYKYPRWIEFVEALPKTATGKIQRHKLRELDHSEEPV